MPSILLPADIARSATEKLLSLREEMKSVPEKETIHKFRVTYKKLRAFYRMMNQVTGDGDYGIKKRWKHLYRSAGALRDNQLMLDRIEQDLPGTALVLLLREQMPRLEKDLSTVIEKERPRAEKFRNFDEPPAEAYGAYFREMMKRWISYSLQTLYDDTLHNLRKLLKDIFYNRAWLEEMKIEQDNLIAQLPVTEMEEMQQVLGDNQDRIVQFNYIRQVAVLPGLQRDGPQLESWLTRAFNDQRNGRMEIESRIQKLGAAFEKILAS